MGKLTTNNDNWFTYNITSSNTSASINQNTILTTNQNEQPAISLYACPPNIRLAI